MDKEIDLVIPLGNGDPSQDIPNIGLLEERLSRIKLQTISVKLTLAICSDFNLNKFNRIKKYADKIIIVAASSYFKKGSIWNVVYSCWEKSDCPFITFHGYDDYSSPDRFEKQLSKIKETETNACLCESWRDTGGNLELIHNGQTDFIEYLGHCFPSMCSFIMRKDAFLNSGADKYKMECANFFEGVHYNFILKTGKPSISEGKFFWYVHPGSLSNTQNNEWGDRMREEAGYTQNDSIRDWNNIPMEQLHQEVRDIWKAKGLTK